ncbi:uncharacterized protein LY79DRAFT_577988 [Colletotrichum navitas]|uniref:Uncharacterized protein n=1 Tax=Colletotrichum navitas TaxID=681940 RepID=A0AAD8Q6M6_9PEZI|nr:uncharacterized protein LY79DRAFT_577988 [Colletotrichum navitas]KAK1595634.1 hypothetical protein LY79DRAFT_577988 [Colletotrichum navitas]
MSAHRLWLSTSLRDTRSISQPSHDSLKMGLGDRKVGQRVGADHGIVRTAYAADNDEAHWAAVLRNLQAYATLDEDDAEMDPDTFVLPVIADSTALRGADYTSVRKAFNEWVDDFIRRERPLDDDDDYDEEWPSDVRRDACIVINEPALASLLRAPDFVPGKIPDLDLEPWVVIVDARDPASVPYGGGGPYMSFMQSHARVLGQLFEDLSSRSLAQAESYSKARRSDPAL